LEHSIELVNDFEAVLEIEMKYSTASDKRSRPTKKTNQDVASDDLQPPAPQSSKRRNTSRRHRVSSSDDDEEKSTTAANGKDQATQRKDAQLEPEEITHDDEKTEQQQQDQSEGEEPHIPEPSVSATDESLSLHNTEDSIREPLPDESTTDKGSVAKSSQAEKMPELVFTKDQLSQMMDDGAPSKEDVDVGKKRKRKKTSDETVLLDGSKKKRRTSQNSSQRSDSSDQIEAIKSASNGSQSELIEEKHAKGIVDHETMEPPFQSQSPYVYKTIWGEDIDQTWEPSELSSFSKTIWDLCIVFS
jgi:hypothetical protein